MLRAQAREGRRRDRPRPERLRGSCQARSDKVSAWTAQASHLAQEEQSRQSARRSTTSAVLADQSQPSTYKLRAEAYAAKGERKRAMADISRALKFAWNADLLKVRGELRLEDGDIDGVIHDAEAMLKIEAGQCLGNGAARRSLRPPQGLRPCACRPRQGDHRPTARIALAYGERGQIYLAKNDSTRALADFNRAIELGSHQRGTLSRPRHDRKRAKATTAKAMSDLADCDPARSAAGRALFPARVAAQGQGRDRSGAGRSERGPYAPAGQHRRSHGARRDQARQGRRGRLDRRL